LYRNYYITKKLKVLIELFQKFAGGGRSPQEVTALMRHGFATISNQGVALWRPYFTNLKKTALPSFYLSDFRVRHQAHDCTEAPIKRVAYQHRRFQGRAHTLLQAIVLDFGFAKNAPLDPHNL